jgi:hypothetical protein
MESAKAVGIVDAAEATADRPRAEADRADSALCLS